MFSITSYEVLSTDIHCNAWSLAHTASMSLCYTVAAVRLSWLALAVCLSVWVTICLSVTERPSCLAVVPVGAVVACLSGGVFLSDIGRPAWLVVGPAGAVAVCLGVPVSTCRRVWVSVCFCLTLEGPPVWLSVLLAPSQRVWVSPCRRVPCVSPCLSVGVCLAAGEAGHWEDDRDVQQRPVQGQEAAVWGAADVRRRKAQDRLHPHADVTLVTAEEHRHRRRR